MEIKTLLTKFSIGGFSTIDINKICNSCWFFYYPKKKHIPLGNSQHLEQMNINNGWMCFRHVTEKKSFESILHKENYGDTNTTSHKNHLSWKITFPILTNFIQVWYRKARSQKRLSKLLRLYPSTKNSLLNDIFTECREGSEPQKTTVKPFYNKQWI